MAKFKLGRTLVGAAALGLALTACSTDSGTTASGEAGARSSSCPTPPAPGPQGAPGAGAAAPSGTPSGVPSGAPGGAGAGNQLPIASTVAKPDTANSKVISATGPQIECGGREVETHDDIVYSTPSTNGTKTELKLDLTVPKTDGAKPLVVYIPGGGFLTAQKEQGLNRRTYIAERGYVVASVHYRTTTDGATYVAGLADVKSAVRYLRAHAGEYGIDPGRVAVWGDSAGGYLAAMAGTTGGVRKFDVGDNLDQSSKVQAVIDDFGPANLSRIGADFDDKTEQANLAAGNMTAKWVYGPDTNKSVAAYTDQVKAADPATYADADDPAFLLYHGDQDRLVSPSQTLALHNALLAKGVDSTRYLITGAGHGDGGVGMPASMTAPWTTRKVVDQLVGFLDDHLGS
ncbi:alpha/beta hydrolase [Streptomyces arenae]|uniref:alpha/beta hydrolase n=1 Tax=Streptomyces arenae TaxID=29301 RepID=UPI00265B0674|nr:alpha/beta hydrolase [Streptomyces arenae]MCG7204454.1 alpha/beta hydrolase [Streptomyces arenae]